MLKIEITLDQESHKEAGKNGITVKIEANIEGASDIEKMMGDSICYDIRSHLVKIAGETGGEIKDINPFAEPFTEPNNPNES